MLTVWGRRDLWLDGGSPDDYSKSVAQGPDGDLWVLGGDYTESRTGRQGIGELYRFDPTGEQVPPPVPVSATTPVDLVGLQDRVSSLGYDWDSVSMLLPEIPFYKWGDGVGTAPRLTYSFTDQPTIQLDEAYTYELDVMGGTGRGGCL